MADHRSPEDPPFCSNRPDGKSADEAFLPPPEHSKLSQEAFQSKIKKVELDFYWSRHEDRGKTRGDLEREWNGLKAEEAHRIGKTWTYKHDRRDDSTFKVEHSTKDGQSRTTTTADANVNQPQHAIHWRNKDQCAYGNGRYQAIQRSAKSRGKLNAGDDLGHLVADEHGADVEGVNRGVVNSKTRISSVERPNYTSQGARTNEHASWREQEVNVTESGKIAPVNYQIVSFATEKHGLHHEQSRTMTATQELNGRSVSLSRPNLIHGGFTDHLTANQREERASLRQQSSGSVEAKKAKIQKATDTQKTKSKTLSTSVNKRK